MVGSDPITDMLLAVTMSLYNQEIATGNENAVERGTIDRIFWFETQNVTGLLVVTSPSSLWYRREHYPCFHFPQKVNFTHDNNSGSQNTCMVVQCCHSFFYQVIGDIK